MNKTTYEAYDIYACFSSFQDTPRPSQVCLRLVKCGEPVTNLSRVTIFPTSISRLSFFEDWKKQPQEKNMINLITSPNIGMWLQFFKQNQNRFVPQNLLYRPQQQPQTPQPQWVNGPFNTHWSDQIPKHQSKLQNWIENNAQGPG